MMISNTLLCDIEYIKGKYHKTDEPFNSFRRMNYHGWECDSSTGLDDAEMSSALGEYVDSLNDTSHAVIKAKAFAFVLDHMRISINPHDYFPVLYNWNRPLNKYTVNRWLSESELSSESRAFRDEYTATGELTCWLDYDHSVPDWDALYRLGFVGIRERAREYRRRRERRSYPLTPSERAYFDSIEIEYSAILRLIRRLRELAETSESDKAPTISACLARLEVGAPTTLYERLMLIYFYFMLSESIDSYQVRSLGSGLDHDLAEPFANDLSSGRFNENQLDDFIGYFLMQFSAIGNYWGQPLYLGGTNLDGSCRMNDMTLRILDIYDKLGIYNPKIQIKYSPDTPDKYLEKVLDMIRRGHSSFVFVCDDNIIESFKSRGVSFERAHDYDVKGCYEFALRAGEFSASPIYINLLAPILRALDDCSDGDSFETLLCKYFDRLGDLFERSIKLGNEMELRLGEVNPAPMLSATITHSLETARDAYFDGAELNTTAFVVGALGSAVDALAAIKTLVYDDRLVTLGQLKAQLAENWSDERLRETALNTKHKYGCHDELCDKLASQISDLVASYQGRPNSRGGCYKVTIHSARQYIEQGKRIPATPDGRRAGDETSKNGSPTQGMDRQGVTALIHSSFALKPSRFTEGFGFDVMLHETAVKGDDGLAAMLGLLRAYDMGGGSTIQFNVFDASTLRDAQANPEKYSSLQVRVCGWNVLWNDMCKAEQDKFIERAENLQG